MTPAAFGCETPMTPAGSCGSSPTDSMPTVSAAWQTTNGPSPGQSPGPSSIALRGRFLRRDLDRHHRVRVRPVADRVERADDDVVGRGRQLEVDRSRGAATQ